MNNTKFYTRILFFIFLLSFLPVNAEKTFIHPGALHTKADLDRVKEKILAKESPWIEAWQLVLNDASSKSTYVANPKTDIGGSDGNRQQAARDFYAAYLNILRWYVTGETAHAECAVRICNAWANTVQKAEGELFQIPIAGAVTTAELLRGTYSGWKTEDIQKFQSVAKTIFYPPCSNFLGVCSHPSWDVQAAASVMAIGIFCDDEGIYNEALNHFKADLTTGGGYGSICVAMDKETGQGFEMGRDQPHAALANASLAQMCEMAWSQGDDLYSFSDNLLLRGFDYYCKFNLNNPLDDWKPVKWCRAAGGTAEWFHVSTHNAAYRLRSSAVYEMVYNHYMVRKELETSKAPYLTALTNLCRPEQGEGGIYLGHGTLMYTLDASKSPLKPYSAPTAPTGLKAASGINCIQLSWTPSAGNTASGYEVYRSTNGSNFTKITSWDGETQSKYTDNSITAGTTYHYYVKATNQSGAGEASNTAVITAVAPTNELLVGWGYADIGSVAAKGNALYVQDGNNTFSVSGAGATMSGTADGHGYAFTKVSGDAAISARLWSSNWPSGSTKVGLVVRETLDANSKRITLSLGDVGARHSKVGIRSDVGGNTTWIEGNDFTYAPIWFKIERSGNVFSVFQSADGVNWIRFAQQTISMAASYYIGLSASAGTTAGDLATAVFDNVIVVNSSGVPALPTKFEAAVVNSTTINLTWDASDAATYIIRRSESANGPFSVAATSISSNSFKDVNLKPNTDYYYSLKSANFHGESTDSLLVTAKTSELTLPPSPTGFKVADAGNAYVSLQWNAGEEQTRYYYIKRLNEDTGIYDKVGISVTTTYVDHTVVNDKYYYYVVSAINTLGEGENSGWIQAKPTAGASYYWTLDGKSGDTEITDVWNNKKLSVPAAAKWQEGKFNNSIYLLSNAYLTLEESVTSNLSNFTISLWLNLASADTWPRIFDFGKGTDNYMFLTPKASSGYLRYAIKNGGTELQINTTTTIKTSEWTHIAITQEGNTGIIYVNGEEVGRNSGLTINPSHLGKTTLNYFGKSMFSADPYLRGSLDVNCKLCENLSYETFRKVFD